ncbi:beta-ketoacyl synthase N-terminal-like domain-containing protein [Streptomyces syringium]
MTVRKHSPRKPVVVTGLSVTTAFGRGLEALRQGLAAGQPAFGPVTRFDVSKRRVDRAATLPGDPNLIDGITDAVTEAIGQAGLGADTTARTPLLFARHADQAPPRLELPEHHAQAQHTSGTEIAERCGLRDATRTYTNACVAASTAIADAAALISAGREERVVVAAGYFVDADAYALFDAGRALAADGHLRSFSQDRKGLLLGDGLGAVVLESAEAADSRGATPIAGLLGWGRAGDAFHVCQPHPEGLGMAAAIGAALGRAELTPDGIDYINAHGTGTPLNDSAETAAILRAFGETARKVPVSSTKSLHGHTLEASGVVEFAVSVLTLQEGTVPVNAGYLGPDPACELNLVLDAPQRVAPRTVLSLNAAFGGANTALVLGAVAA